MAQHGVGDLSNDGKKSHRVKMLDDAIKLSESETI